jgi:hypothetical protein
LLKFYMRPEFFKGQYLDSQFLNSIMLGFYALPLTAVNNVKGIPKAFKNRVGCSFRGEMAGKHPK